MARHDVHCLFVSISQREIVDIYINTLFKDKLNLKGISKDKNTHRRCSVKRDVPKNFPNFIANPLWWSLFLINLQAFRPTTLLKRDCNAGVFV